MRRPKGVTLLRRATAALTLVGGILAGTGSGQVSGTDSQLVDRLYHEAWFQWAVEGRVDRGHAQLRMLARRLDLTPSWQMRIGRDLAHCELLLGEDLEALNRLTRLQQGVGAASVEQALQALVDAARESLSHGRTVVGTGASTEPVASPGDDPSTTATDHAGDAGPGATDDPTAAGTDPDPATEEPEALLSPDGATVPVRPPDPSLTQVPRPGEATGDEGRSNVIPERTTAGRVVATDLPRLLATLDRRVERWRESLTKDQKVPRVAGLVGRRYGGTLSEDSNKVYDAATFSFVYATRDNRRLTHNDWDMQFGNTGTRIHVDMVTNDRSQIWDVGKVDFDELRLARPTFAGVEHLYLQPGHVYLLHIRDWNTDLWVVIQPLELNKHEWVIFRWRQMEMPR